LSIYKKSVLFFILCITIISCDNANSNNSTTVDCKIENQESDSFTKENITKKRSQKKPIVKSLLSNRVYSSLKIDSILIGTESWIKERQYEYCIEDSSYNTISIDKKKRDEYLRSSLNSNQRYGRFFCIKNNILDKYPFARIIHQQTEGGHRSDVVSIISLADSNLLFRLPLNFIEEWDGQSKKVESTVHNDGRITREIIEVIHNEHLERITNQIFQIETSGEIIEVKKTISEINFNSKKL